MYQALVSQLTTLSPDVYQPLAERETRRGRGEGEEWRWGSCCLYNIFIRNLCPRDNKANSSRKQDYLT